MKEFKFCIDWKPTIHIIKAGSEEEAFEVANSIEIDFPDVELESLEEVEDNDDLIKVVEWKLKIWLKS